MKKIKNTKKTSVFKKLFIKFCRILGFEIIDQSSFSSPTLQKDLNEILSIQGQKSITIPLGQIYIKKKIKSLKIIVRTCTAELIMDQNKKRIFEQDKSEYTFRTIKSLIKSIHEAKKNLTNINFELMITDVNSQKQDLEKINDILKVSNLKSKITSVDLNKFKNRIKEGYSSAKFSNMANFYNSLLIAKNEEADMIYFVEDDYIHYKSSIAEMVYSYEKFYSLFSKEVILLPSDYPYLYTKDEATKIYLGEKNHWRQVSESLVTFMTSKELIVKHFTELEKMGVEWVDPWEKPLHNLYKDYPCLSPIPSLAIHCANINSVFGVSPLCDIKYLWDENEN